MWNIETDQLTVISKDVINKINEAQKKRNKKKEEE